MNSRSTPLDCSIQFIHIFDYIIDKGANINIQNRDGDTILHKACRYEDVTIKIFGSTLLKTGPDPTIVNRDNKTPVDIARQYNPELLSAFE